MDELGVPRMLEWLAWRRYLRAVRLCDPSGYEAAEDGAWTKLQADLDELAGAFRPGHEGRARSREQVR